MLSLFYAIILGILHTSNDLLKMANEKTPADKRFVSSEQTEDPAESDIEGEENLYYQTWNNNPGLASPIDEERNFVRLLKKHYHGSFPEYSKETKADYARNRELDDNLNIQPETVFFGHSDVYHGKKAGKYEDTNDFSAPDDIPPYDSLDAFDGDSNIWNAKSHDTNETETFPTDINNPTKTPFYTTAWHHTDEPREDSNDIQSNVEIQRENTESPQSEVNDLTQDYETAQGSAGDGEELSGMNEEHNEASGTDEVGAHELEKMEEKMYEKILSNKIEKSSPKLLPDKEPSIHIEKSNKKENFTTILKEFDELKGNNNIKGGHTGMGGDSVGSMGTIDEKESQKLQIGKNKARKVSNTNGDFKGTGDAILDFLDKLLEKDPKELRHDVLAMAKEMKNEETNSKDEKTTNLANEQPIPSLGQPSYTSRKPQRKHGNSSLKNVDNKVKEIGKSISELEHKINEEKEVVDQTRSDKNYDNEEYDEFHSSPEIYPDNNGGAEAFSEYNALDAGTKSKANENDGKTEKFKQKKQDEFDYEEFKEEALKMHNEFRSRHHVDALEWSEKLARKAHEIAVQLINATRSFFKREIEKKGESIAILPYTAKNIAKSAVEKWYSEITRFSFANPDIKPETRDFTQIIWKGSKHIGMGFAYSMDRKKTLVVALYSPAGNNQNELRKNLSTDKYDLYADIRKASIEKDG